MSSLRNVERKKVDPELVMWVWAFLFSLSVWTGVIYFIGSFFRVW